MSDPRAELAAVEARAEQLRRILSTGDCRAVGCEIVSYGGRNAGCELGDGCGCSVPVNVCRKCGDCDYGDNADAIEVRRACAEGCPQ